MKKLKVHTLLLLLVIIIFSATSCITKTTAHVEDEDTSLVDEGTSLVNGEEDKEDITEGDLNKEEEQKNLDKIKDIIMNDSFSELLLVSKKHPLEVDYMKSFITKNTLPATKDVSLNEMAHKELEKLFQDIKDDNIDDLLITSAYRDMDYQTMLFEREMQKYINNYTEEEAYDLASEAVAIPGTSEHQTGLAIDFLSSTQYSLTSSFENTASGKWLFDNAYKYGFILRFPKDKTDVTEIMYEPWHYRYIGTPHAEYMTKQNLCLEEYHDLLQSEGTISFADEEGNNFNVTYISNMDTFDFSTSEINEENIVDVSHLGHQAYIVTTALSK